jgi:DNA-binding NarL/FixJ family response regulator
MERRHERLHTGHKHRLLLVDDHPVTREGLAGLLNQYSDFEVCGQASTAPEGLAAAARLKPDLVLVDISLGGTSGLELVKDLAIRHPTLPSLVLSTFDEQLYAERALRAGARGYVMKHEPTQQVIAAIRLVLRGGRYLSEQMGSRLFDKLSGRPAAPRVSEVDQLSDRELEVFELIGEGCTTAQIAAGLHLSVSTVETHRAHIKEKLKLENATELVRRAVEWVQRAAT